MLSKIFKLPLGIYIPSIFMNTAFVGFPVVFFAYGIEGLTRAIAYDFFNGIYIFTIGIYIISRRKDALDVFKFPFLYAALSGMILNLSGFIIPETLLKAIDMLAGITIPLALLMLGFRLGMIKIRSLNQPFLVSILRMVLGTAIAWVIVVILRIESDLGKVLIVMSALPSAFMGMVLAEKYRSDVELISSSIALCTILSIVFLPILLMLLK